MANTIEMSHYMEIYLKCIDPLFTMFSQWDKGTRLVYFIQPRSHAQFVIKYPSQEGGEETRGEEKNKDE